MAVSSSVIMVVINCDQVVFNRENILKEMRQNEDFFDVTLACDESQVEAHKVVLSTTSTVLQQILKKNISPHPVIFLRGTSKILLKYIVDFMYNGSVEVELAELDAFIGLAVDLKIKGIDPKQFVLGKDVARVIDFAHKEEVKAETPKNDGDGINQDKDRKLTTATSPIKRTESSSCILCQAPLSSNLSEIWFHYSLCYYDQGALFPKFPPGPNNSDEAGKPIDDVGVEVFYSCSEMHCCYTGKNLGYKEFLLHQAMCHRMLEEVIMEEQRDDVQDGLHKVLLTKNGYRYRAECFKTKIKALNLSKHRKRQKR